MKVKESMEEYFEEMEGWKHDFQDKKALTLLTGEWNNEFISSYIKREEGRAKKLKFKTAWFRLFIGFFQLLKDYLLKPDEEHEVSKELLGKSWKRMIKEFEEDSDDEEKEEEKNEDEDLKTIPIIPKFIEFNEKGKKKKSKKSKKNKSYYSFEVYNFLIYIVCESIKRFYDSSEMIELAIPIYEGDDLPEGKEMKYYVDKAKKLCEIQNYNYFLLRALAYERILFKKGFDEGNIDKLYSFFSQNYRKFIHTEKFREEKDKAVYVVCQYRKTNDETDLPICYPTKIYVRDRDLE